MSIRTDIAAESFSQAGGAEKLQGVKVKNKVIENARLEVTDITIETQEAAEKLGRPIGRYITLTATDSTFDMYSDSFRERAEVIAKAIGELCGECERFLAVGLGNYALTSYQNLLRDGGTENSVSMNCTNGEMRLNSWPPQQGSVTTYAKQVGGKQVIHLLNFSQANSLSWRDVDGTDRKSTRLNSSHSV